LKNIMDLLTHIYQTIVSLAKQAWLLPRTAAIAVDRRRQQHARAEAEAERLDRIRNPYKYLGK
jgi:Skp family chaperone for outer membrane proteins